MNTYYEGTLVSHHSENRSAPKYPKFHITAELFPIWLLPILREDADSNSRVRKVAGIDIKAPYEDEDKIISPWDRKN